MSNGASVGGRGESGSMNSTVQYCTVGNDEKGREGTGIMGWDGM